MLKSPQVQARKKSLMRLAIVHELWGAGAARCAQDLRRELGRNHDVRYFPRSNAVETSKAIVDALTEFRPDVVHCHSFYGNLPYEFLTFVAHRYPTCFTVHDPRPIGTLQSECWECHENSTCRHCPLVGSTWRQYLRNPYYQLRKVKRDVHENCPTAMQIVAPSRWMKERLASQELSRFDIRHINYGIDLDHFRHVPGGRLEFDLPANRPVILFSSWYESPRAVGVRKGLADLATAFLEQVLPAIPNAILAVAGESFAPNHPNVRPLGLVSIDRLPRLLSAADVYVLPTLADNLPYTIMEAMGCGVPVVATNVGGIPEQIAHNVTGLLVPPAHPRELGEAIVALLSNEDRALKMGANGRSRAVDLFSMRAFVEAHERLFQEMVGAGGVS
jgi:glycosyltransferase involved in cell wall biosynthesis